MKKKLLSTLAAVMIMISFSACGTPGPTETADTFMTAIKEKDAETVKSVYAGKTFDLLQETGKESDDTFEGTLDDALAEKIFDFDYKLSDEKIDGDKATVKVSITTYDLGSAIEDFISEYLTQAITLSFSGASDKQIEKLSETLLAKHMKKVEKDYTGTAKIHLTKKDGKWQIDKFDDNSDFINALSGGVVESIKNIEEIYDTEE